MLRANPHRYSGSAAWMEPAPIHGRSIGSYIYWPGAPGGATGGGRSLIAALHVALSGGDPARPLLPGVDRLPGGGRADRPRRAAALRSRDALLRHRQHAGRAAAGHPVLLEPA